jgi:nucleoside 2-deoxyribosyltransferase
MSTIYLAGPITGLNYATAVNWRIVAEQKLSEKGIKALSPMRQKEYLHGQTCLEALGYEDTLLSKQKAMVARDRYDVQRCDAVLMYLNGAEQVSVGTMVELGWCDAWRKPVILVMEKGNVHDHAFIRELADFIVADLHTAISVAVSLLALTSN